MNSLTIAQLSQFSGIKPHTIRIWEQRYQALSPTRSAGNTRTYSGLDLKRLLNIVSLMGSDHKVAELCSMNNEALNSLIKNLYSLENSENSNHFVLQLLSAGMDFDESSFQKIFSHCLLRFGVDGTYKNVIYPLLNRIGLMWSSDMLPPAYEHFMCNLMRQKLLTAIDSLPSPKEASPKWLLFLPEDEYHEMGLLYANYVARKNGVNTVYLGASVPLTTLGFAIENFNPDALLLFFIHRDFPEKVNAYLAEIDKLSGYRKIYISGYEKLMDQVKLTKNIQWLKNIDDLQNI
ncbi:MAG TPA: MerR family transcriptional regulator [Aequorivita sp.]|nr:MerR family transcriptional regulator [Aequorivita sp.]